jgi:hypothetical protein
MREHGQRGNHIHLGGGRYKTFATNQFNRGGRGFTINCQVTCADDAVVERDVEAVTDEDISSEPQYLLMGQAVHDDPNRSREEYDTMMGEQVFAALPRGQAVRGGTFVPHHSQLVERWKAKGHSLRGGAVCLHGQNAAIERANVVDGGAWRYVPPGQRFDAMPSAESFPLLISIATSGYDQTKLANLDPEKYLADRKGDGEVSHLVGNTFDGYVPSASNDQVSFGMINGGYGERGRTWDERRVGDWGFLWREDCYSENNIIRASGSNLVQGLTHYLAKKGRIRGNKSYGADVLCYWDYLQSEGQTVEENVATDCRIGIVLQLSPGPPVDLARSFYIKEFTLGLNKLEAREAQVSIRPFAAEWIEECRKAGVSPTPNTRSISGIRVDKSLTAHDEIGAVTQVGVDRNKRRGCF